MDTHSTLALMATGTTRLTTPTRAYSVPMFLVIWRLLTRAHLRVKRKDGRITLTFADSLLTTTSGPGNTTKLPSNSRHSRPPTSTQDAFAPTELVIEKQHFTLDRATLLDLATALDSQPNTRIVLRHLAICEEVLRTTGSPGLQSIPVKHLLKAHGQLALLIPKHGTRALIKLSDAIKQSIQRRQPTHEISGVLDTGPDALEWLDRRNAIEISDGRVSDFYRALETAPDSAPQRGHQRS